MYNIKIYLRLTHEFNRLKRAKSRDSELRQVSFIETKGPREKEIGCNRTNTTDSRRHMRQGGKNSFIIRDKNAVRGELWGLTSIFGGDYVTGGVQSASRSHAGQRETHFPLFLVFKGDGRFFMPMMITVHL